MMGVRLMRALHQRLEPVPVRRQEAIVEILRDAVQCPWGGLALVAARDQPADFFAPVDEVIRIADRRQVFRHIGNRARDEIEVRHRCHGQVEPDHRGNFGAPLSTRIHDDLGLNRAAVGDDSGDTSILERDRLHARLGQDLRPTFFAPSASA